MIVQPTNGGRFIEPELRYWWCGEDELVDGQWVDRIGGIVNFTAGTGVERINGGYHVGKSRAVNGQDYFWFGEKTTISDLDFGNHFRIEYIFDLIWSSKTTYPIVDYGSIAQTTKGFSFAVSTTPAFTCNWKMKGNGSNPGLTAENYQGTIAAKVINDKHGHLAFEIIQKNKTYDSMRVTDLDTGLSEYSHPTINIPKARYTNFKVDGSYFHPIWIGRSAIYSSAGTYSEINIYDIKIYVYD